MQKRSLRSLLPAAALLLALDITLTAGMLRNSDALDARFGSGKRMIVTSDSYTDANYYAQRYATQEEARAAAAAVSEQISDEGIVLLKNDGLLPLADPMVSPFGYGYLSPLYCGSGSSAISTLDKDVISPSEGLHAVFSHVNTALEQLETQAVSDGVSLLATRPLSEAWSADVLYEFDARLYDQAEESCRHSVALVFITRRGGEDSDFCPLPYEDGTPHMLALTDDERAVIRRAASLCEGVVVVLSSPSAMQVAELEDSDEVDAVVWMGGAGSTGYLSLAKVLAGEVVPSGKTPFIFAADFTADVTYANLDDGSEAFVYGNAGATALTSTAVEEVAVPFHEYEEGVYFGYRYYETAWDIGALPDYYSRENGVVYPFGYGLSYTTFAQRLICCAQESDRISITVEVTNTGSAYAGQDVVQIYAQRPYTELDREYGIEKPAVVLAAFAKTRLLSPGESTAITLTFSMEDLASYCATHSNPDGTLGGYMLDAGEYAFSLRADSHRILDTCSIVLAETVWFSGDAGRGGEANVANRFPDLNAYMADSTVSGAVSLSRADWVGTQPSAPNARDRVASEAVLSLLNRVDAPPAADQSPAKAGEPLALADLRGLDADDPAWMLLVSQVDDKLVLLRTLSETAYHTSALTAIGLPAADCYDGPQGLTMANAAGESALEGFCGYPAAPVMAATWNQELMYTYGCAVAQEALCASISVWYAPALNLIRSPFCGRASEYLGEDPLLNGLIGVQIVSGAGDCGLCCAVKHFALHESETHRSTAACTFMTEQTLREIYLRPFELVVKRAQKTIACYAGGELVMRTLPGCDFIMAADSAVGTTSCAASAALLTQLLRDEWGFEGAVITDMHMQITPAAAAQMWNAGCDLIMSVSGAAKQLLGSEGIGTAVLYRSLKNLCYTFAHSSLMQGIAPSATISYRLASWRLALWIVNGGVALLLLIYAGLLAREIGRSRRRFP